MSIALVKVPLVSFSTVCGRGAGLEEQRQHCQRASVGDAPDLDADGMVLLQLPRPGSGVQGEVKLHHD
jgi:hypothetical protein